MRILTVVGARPNFMKAAPIISALGRHPRGFVCALVHTGQHYDDRMSNAFFGDLGLPNPDVNLGVGSGSHAEQTASVMLRVEPVMKELSPDLVIVVGDVNSTLACALTAKKLNLRVAHIEAGLRSFDMTMPEEINRICTDAISDHLFTTDRIANENLKREGIQEQRIHFVGNVMIDSLFSHLEAARKLSYERELGLENGGYATLTLHRPSNVDNRDKLAEILGAVEEALPDLPVVFPAHPRTRARIKEFGLQGRFDNGKREGVSAMDPLGYLQFLSLNCGAQIVITDSGGLQEEATALRIPCVTVRENTERPITIDAGTNHLAGTTRRGILTAIAEALQVRPGDGRQPELWDGQASERIVSTIATF